MGENLRQSGIEVLGNVPWGTHFCQFYQTKEDLTDILLPYFKSGLENNEFCFWVTSQPLEAEEAKEALRTVIPDIDVHLEKGQIEIIPYTQVYVNEGIFDSEKVINGWAKKLELALSKGYDGLRVAGATSWLKKEDWDDFVAYEKKADASIGKKPMISLCPYFLEICSAADILDVAFNHQSALIKRDGKWERMDNSGREIPFGQNPAEEVEEVIPLEEPRPGIKRKNIFSPSREIANLELAEIIDIRAVQSMMNDFYKFAHVTIGLVDLKGNVLVWVGWQDICTRFHRVHPEACKHCIESDTKLSAGVAPGEFKLYKCKNNMWDVATPIVVGGHHVGNIFSGQFFFEDEPLDYEFFRAQARKYGFNEEEYIAALEKVPRLSREYVDTVMSFFMKFAHMISQLSYINVKLAQSLTEREALVDALRMSEKCERARSDEMAVLLDAVPAAVWIAHDPQAYHITGNRLSYEWLRIPPGSNASKSSPPGERSETFKVFRDGVELPPADMPLHVSAAGKELLDYEFDFVYPEGVVRHVLGNARPLHDEIGNPRGSVAAFIDITGRKKTEEALQKAYGNLEEKVKERTVELEEAYRALVENERRLSEAQKIAHLGIWDWDFVNDEVYWSDEMYHIFGCTSGKSGLSHNDFLTQVHPDDQEYVDNTFKRALKGEPFSIDHRIIRADGENRVVHIQGGVVFDEKNNFIRIRGTVQDITESKRAEERIKILADAVESSDDAIITESLDGIITSWNKGAEQIYGYSAEEILGKNISLLEPAHLKGDMKQLTEKIKRKEKIQRHRTLRFRKDGTPINVSITLSPIFNSSGEFVSISAISRDITERIRAEEALAKIEEARKKEIHHRIKNNLQVISSLLDLQAEKFLDKEVLEAFRESQSRVLSMSLIHEELYKGGETDTLDFSAYLRKLSGNLLQTYSLCSKNVHLHMDLEENSFFNMDTAVPLGIIVNELVSNSLKHAFSGNKEGEIRIRLCREEKNNEIQESLFSLTISDDGKGIPENIELENVESLGLQLVNILVDQLDGNIELKHDQGTECRIEFKVIER
ncbi:sensory transduction histidine kinase [Methanosarcina siciliae T4/M]|uniref:Sensory transduction histidine kinase n=1 Tax=Methanosarcina siciliae T4/M TaxID=1434120 RepID=A0A0E3P1X0_9EURY|nr:PocR ligand-binding domain-containing protein [Methanosarcina siciliae]AKB27388.1 sensory transduction histidine kinase [Methanosarcina siciliae T4/M]